MAPVGEATVSKGQRSMREITSGRVRDEVGRSARRRAWMGESQV